MLFEKTRKLEFPLADLVAMLEKRPPHRIAGTAVFLTSDPNNAPTALLHSLKHYKVLHERNVILTIETAPTPSIDPAERVRLEQISPTFSRSAAVRIHAAAQCAASARDRAQAGLAVRHHVDFVLLSRRALKPAADSGMPRWQDHLFIALAVPPMMRPTTSKFRPAGWLRWERRSQFDAPPAGCQFTVNGRSTEPMHSPAIACKRMLLRDGAFNVLFELANMRPRPANSVTTRAASFAQTFTRSSAPWVPKASHCKALLDVSTFIAADRYPLAAMVVAAIDQQAAHAHLAHFAERDFRLARHFTTRKPRLDFMRSIAATISGRSSTLTSRSIVLGA